MELKILADEQSSDKYTPFELTINEEYFEGAVHESVMSVGGCPVTDINITWGDDWPLDLAKVEEEIKSHYRSLSKSSFLEVHPCV